MPDDELIGFGPGPIEPRKGAQVKRMLNDGRGRAVTQNFVGQWLQVRDLDGMFFNERAILRARRNPTRRGRHQANVLVAMSVGP